MGVPLYVFGHTPNHFTNCIFDLMVVLDEKNQAATKVITHHSERNMDGCTKFQINPSDSHPDISVRTKVGGPADRHHSVISMLKMMPTNMKGGVGTGNRRGRGNVYLKGTACVLSGLLSGTMTTLQSDWLSCWVYPWCFVASSNSS